MSKERKDLTFIHSYIEPSDGLHTIAKRFCQVVDLEELMLLLKVHLLHAGGFKVLRFDKLRFKLVINFILFLVCVDELLAGKRSLSRLERILLVLLAHFNDTFAVSAPAQVEAIPVGRRQPITRVEPMSLGASCSRHDIIDVDSENRI